MTQRNHLLLYDDDSKLSKFPLAIVYIDKVYKGRFYRWIKHHQNETCRVKKRSFH